MVAIFAANDIRKHLLRQRMCHISTLYPPPTLLPSYRPTVHPPLTLTCDRPTHTPYTHSHPPIPLSPLYIHAHTYCVFIWLCSEPYRTHSSPMKRETRTSGGSRERQAPRWAPTRNFQDSGQRHAWGCKCTVSVSVWLWVWITTRLLACTVISVYIIYPFYPKNFVCPPHTHIPSISTFTSTSSHSLRKTFI